MEEKGQQRRDGAAAVMSSGHEIVVGHVAAAVHGRYLLRQAPEAAPLLVGFHGYGEAADSIMQALLEISVARDWHVASIQALHPFYNLRTREVVACWMTKQDRDLAVVDNVAYVKQTLATLAQRLEITGPTVFAGFSQGSAMAYRAAAALGDTCQGVVALAGDVPPEIAQAEHWGCPPVLIGRGTQDAWYNEAKWEHDEALLQGLGSSVEACVFEGGHEWTGTFRRHAGDFLRRLQS